MKCELYRLTRANYLGKITDFIYLIREQEVSLFSFCFKSWPHCFCLLHPGLLKNNHYQSSFNPSSRESGNHLFVWVSEQFTYRYILFKSQFVNFFGWNFLKKIRTLYCWWSLFQFYLLTTLYNSETAHICTYTLIWEQIGLNTRMSFSNWFFFVCCTSCYIYSGIQCIIFGIQCKVSFKFTIDKEFKTIMDCYQKIQLMERGHHFWFRVSEEVWWNIPHLSVLYSNVVSLLSHAWFLQGHFFRKWTTPCQVYVV